MSGKKSRDKGGREEREIVKIIKSYGFPAKRVPLSGAAIGFKGDIHAEFPLGSGDTIIESKVRKDGFKQIYKWLTGNDMLVIRADREKHLIVMPLEDYLDDLRG
jgi:Holliday junction resolvase